jgi:hypothetical protein
MGKWKHEKGKMENGQCRHKIGKWKVEMRYGKMEIQKRERKMETQKMKMET